MTKWELGEEFGAYKMARESYHLTYTQWLEEMAMRYLDPPGNARQHEAPASSEVVGLQAVRDQLEVQGRDGNWNHDQYMLGMYNGLECALATLEVREPEYRELPTPASSEVVSRDKEKVEMSDLPEIKSAWRIACDRGNYNEAVRLIYDEYTNDRNGKFFQLPMYAMKKYAFLIIARYHGLDIPLDSRVAPLEDPQPLSKEQPHE